MITAIAAVSRDGYIAQVGGALPARLPSDMEHFKRVTMGHTVVMGRKTWDSIPLKYKPLPGRRNIVLTRQLNFSSEGTEVFHTLEDILQATTNDEQVFLAGGEEVYRQSMPIAERLLITRVDKVLGTGDARFPNIDPEAWNLLTEQELPKGERDECVALIEDWSPKLQYIELANVRSLKQLHEYRLIRQRQHCPFCPEQLSTYHNNPIIREGNHWLLTQNDYPYPDTDTHLLLIHRRHAEKFSDISREAQLELFALATETETHGYFTGGGLCVRVGDPLRSGASVKHLHFHLICPRRGGKQIKFTMGSTER